MTINADEITNAVNNITLSTMTADTYKAVCEYLRIDSAETDESTTIKMLMTVAKSYILDYTAIPEEEIDNYKDLQLAFMVLIGEMYDNRVYTIDNSKVNPLVKSILQLHNRNEVGILD